MYKLIACDLDETLLDTNHLVSQRNKQAITLASKKGVKFVIATGRGYSSTDFEVNALDLVSDDEYMISFNGGVLSTNKTHELLFCQGISFEKAKQLFTRGLQYDVCMHVYTLDNVYVYNYVDEEKAYISGRMPIIELKDSNIDFISKEKIIKVIYMNLDNDYLHEIAQQVSDLTADIEVSYSSNRYLEFNYQGVDKGFGLIKLAQILDIDIKDTIAIGDNHNDLAMIKQAGLGVAVKNAKAEVKSEAGYVCSNDNDHDAIAEVIERFIL